MAMPYFFKRCKMILWSAASAPTSTTNSHVLYEINTDFGSLLYSNGKSGRCFKEPKGKRRANEKLEYIISFSFV